MLPKPPELFARDDEWADLARFCTDERPGARLGLLYGRRRQGKTLMLELMAEATGGLLLSGLQQSRTQDLAQVADAVAARLDLAAPPRLDGWPAAVDALLRLGEGDRPVPLLLDEFPYLVATAPELPSVLQAALSPRGRARTRSRARVVLCGSALSTMAGLLAGSAPLRGRAGLELLVHPFDVRETARFWGLADQPDVAVRLHALIGGTPAYRDFCDEDGPGDGDVDAWVARRLLDPSGPMLREGGVLLAEDGGLGDVAPLAVLSAVAAGSTRRGQVAAAVGRAETAVASPLAVLERLRLLERQPDALRQNRSTFVVTEPVVRLHQLVVARHEPRLLRRAGAQVWAEVADTVSSRVYGPHWERLAREWTAQRAPAGLLGGVATTVAPTVVQCREHRTGHELDVVAVQDLPGEPRRVLAVGEAKWRDRPVGPGEVERLRHVRDLLPPALVPLPPRLLVFSRRGATPEVLQDGDVEVVDPARLLG